MMFEFDFDRVMIYINSENKAVFGMNIIHSIEESMKTKGIYNVRYFLCKGLTYFGNLGSNVLKKSVVGGPIKIRLNEMMETTSSIPIPVAKRSGDSKKFSDSQFFVCYRCMLVLKNNFEIRKLCTENVWECGNRLKVKDNEWMYELEQKSELCRWDVYNRAVACFEKKEYEESKKLFKEFEQEFKDDEPTKLWLEMIEGCKEIDDVESKEKGTYH